MPQQNGVSERMNRTLVETIWSMLVDSRLPHKFWAEALSMAAYLTNRSPTKSLDGMTPFEAWYGKKPNVNHLRVFGCAAYLHVPKDDRKKLDPKAKKCIFLGYGATRKGYHLYNQKTSAVMSSSMNSQEVTSVNKKGVSFVWRVSQMKNQRSHKPRKKTQTMQNRKARMTRERTQQNLQLLVDLLEKHEDPTTTVHKCVYVATELR